VPAESFSLPRTSLARARLRWDVIANAFEVTRPAIVNRHGFVSSTEKVSKEAVPMVETHGVGAQQPFHAGHEIGARGFEHEMKMIPHQAPGGSASRFCRRLRSRSEKQLAILIGAKDRFPMMPRFMTW
jgi:hypothetical protein